MLLAIDIGNSSIKFGIFERAGLISKFTVATVRTNTEDEIFALVKNDLDGKKISAVIIVSVVPELTETFKKFGAKFLNLSPIFVDSTFNFNLTIRYFPPEKLGVDRIVAAEAASVKYGKPCLVCDFGTATTIDAVNGRGEFLGGIIAPGVNLLADALACRTSQLPHIEISKPEKVIGNSTVSAIQSGIYFGYIGLVEGIITRITAELGEQNLRIIATGGFAGLIADGVPLIEIVDDNLILEGLRLIYERF